jgi:hypothetical protein
MGHHMGSPPATFTSSAPTICLGLAVSAGHPLAGRGSVAFLPPPITDLLAAASDLSPACTCLTSTIHTSAANFVLLCVTQKAVVLPMSVPCSSEPACCAFLAHGRVPSPLPP